MSTTDSRDSATPAPVALRLARVAPVATLWLVVAVVVGWIVIGSVFDGFLDRGQRTVLAGLVMLVPGLAYCYQGLVMLLVPGLAQSHGVTPPVSVSDGLIESVRPSSRLGTRLFGLVEILGATVLIGLASLAIGAA